MLVEISNTYNMDKILKNRIKACVTAMLFTITMMAVAADDNHQFIEDSIERYQIAIKANPHNVENYVKLGRMYLIANQVEPALLQFKKAIELKPDNAPAYAGLARALEHKNDFAGAVNALRRACKLDGSDADYHYKLGQVLLRTQSIDEAVPELQEAVRLDPNMAAAHKDLGLAYGLKGGNIDKQIEEEEKAVKLSSTDADAYFYLGTAYISKKIYTSGKEHISKEEAAPAVNNLKRSVALDARNSAAWQMLGTAYFLSDDTDAAIASVQQALKLDPGSEENKKMLQKLQQQKAHGKKPSK
jgi:cytochrome c-type biogenesis protein CcmH/NrfG